jgi:signal transduction histidine kinase
MIQIRSSFSAKVVLWLLLIVLPIFLVTVGYLFMQTRKLVHTEAEERAHGALHAAMQYINRYFITVETAVNTHAWMVEQSQDPDTLTSIIHTMASINPIIDGSVLAMESNVVRQHPQHFMTYSIKIKDSLRTGIEQELDYFCREWYTEPRRQKAPCWLLYQEDSLSLNLSDMGMVATYNKPIYDAQQRFIGIISAEMSLQHLSKMLLEETLPYAHSYYVILDEKGRYVGHPDTTRLFKKTIFDVADPQKNSDVIALGYEMTKGKEGHMSVNINNQRSLVCYMPIPNTKWSLAIVSPESDIFKYYNRLTYIMVILFILGLTAVCVHTYKSVTMAIRPLELLLDKTKAIAEGHVDVDIVHTERTDAIGVLQNSFATMQESLNSYLESINEASEQNQQYNQELEHTMQMAMESERQKTIFIQNVTHQIRTPLNIIMGFAQVLNNMPKDENPSSGLSSEELKNIVQSMTYNSKQLIRMVLMLYDSSENGQKMTRKLHIEKVAVDATMKEMLNYIHEESPDVDIAYSNSLPAGFCMNTDRRSIGYSIYELLHNAIKYSDKQHISLDVEQEDGRVRFIVQDTGSGISDTNREHIFNFFVKADRYSEGLGLGLPLAMRHAQMLGGQLTLDTGYQEGCRFIFEIPI